MFFIPLFHRLPADERNPGVDVSRDFFVPARLQQLLDDQFAPAFLVQETASVIWPFTIASEISGMSPKVRA